jgi:hypothetical protein
MEDGFQSQARNPKSNSNGFTNELCIPVFAKSLQNSYPTVWQMSFAFLLTWQNPGMG